MKQILLLITTISMFCTLVAQENTWEVYLQGQEVKSIDFEDNYVWAATNSSLVRLNKLDKSTTNYLYPYIEENSSFYKLKVDKNGVKWIARSEYLPEGKSVYESYNSSIYSFDGNQWKNVKSMGYGSVYSLAVDKNNNKWIAAMGKNGLYKIEKDSVILYTPENSGLIYNSVNCVSSDKNGDIWLTNAGNLGGLFSADIEYMKYDGESWISYLSERGIYLHNSIICDCLGHPWVQNLAFMGKLDTVTKSWSEQINMGLDHPYILQAIDVGNKFWFKKADGGIVVYDGSEWIYYNTSTSDLTSDEVYQIAIDTDNTKWIGTANGLAVLKSTTTNTSISKLDQEFELFPNPANDFITLKIPKEAHNSTADMLNIQGKVIKSFSIDENQSQLDISHLPSGIYMVRIQSDKKQIAKKFVKQ